MRNINGHSLITADSLVVKQPVVLEEMVVMAAGLIVLLIKMAAMAVMAVMPMPMACRVVAAQQNLLSIK